MTTQVIFKIDKNLKDKAMKKAQNQGIAFASVLKLATKAFVEGQLNIAIVEREEFNAKTRREINAAIKDIEANRNLSPAFKTVAEMKKYLEK